MEEDQSFADKEKLARYGLYHCGRLPLLLVSISILNALIKSCLAGTPGNYRFDSTNLLVYLRTSWCLSRQLVVSQPASMSCVTNCYVVCVTRGFLPFDNPYPLNSCPPCLFSLPPLRTSGGSFSFCTCSLFSTTTTLSFHYYFYRLLTTHHCCMCPLFISPSLIPTSSYQLAYLHCNINSKLYSMLSTCLSVSPISIPPIFSTSASLPRFLTPGRITVRLRGEGGTR